MKITQNPSPNFTQGRNSHTPDLIVCHITEGAFNGTLSWIANPASQVSYHFVVAKDGRIAQAVDIKNTAWANGTTLTGSRGNKHSPLATVRNRNTNANQYTISIGFEGRHAQTAGAITPQQQKSAIFLIAYIRKAVQRIYGIKIPLATQHLVGHSHITPRWKPHCPGNAFPFAEILQGLKAQKQPVPSHWAANAWAWGKQHRITDGSNPQGKPTREQMVQLLYNYHNHVASM